MKIYVSGGISGIKDRNREAFEKACESIFKIANDMLKFETYGLIQNRHGVIKSSFENKIFEIINPLDIARQLEINNQWLGKKEPSYADYLKADLKYLGECEACFFLKGWEKSKGASLERQICELTNIRILDSTKDIVEYIAHLSNQI